MFIFKSEIKRCRSVGQHVTVQTTSAFVFTTKMRPLSKSEIPSLWPSSEATQARLSISWSVSLDTAFLMTGPNWDFVYSNSEISSLIFVTNTQYTCLIFGPYPEGLTLRLTGILLAD